MTETGNFIFPTTQHRFIHPMSLLRRPSWSEAAGLQCSYGIPYELTKHGNHGPSRWQSMATFSSSVEDQRQGSAKKHETHVDSPLPSLQLLFGIGAPQITFPMKTSASNDTGVLTGVHIDCNCNGQRQMGFDLLKWLVAGHQGSRQGNRVHNENKRTRVLIDI